MSSHGHMVLFSWGWMGKVAEAVTWVAAVLWRFLSSHCWAWRMNRATVTQRRFISHEFVWFWKFWIWQWHYSCHIAILVCFLDQRVSHTWYRSTVQQVIGHSLRRSGLVSSDSAAPGMGRKGRDERRRCHAVFFVFDDDQPPKMFFGWWWWSTLFGVLVSQVLAIRSAAQEKSPNMLSKCAPWTSQCQDSKGVHGQLASIDPNLDVFAVETLGKFQPLKPFFTCDTTTQRLGWSSVFSGTSWTLEKVNHSLAISHMRSGLSGHRIPSPETKNGSGAFVLSSFSDGEKRFQGSDMNMMMFQYVSSFMP